MISAIRFTSPLLLSFAVFITGITAAQDDADSPSLIRVPKLGTNPLAIVTLSSANRAKQKFQALCDIAGHPEAAKDIIRRIDEATDTLGGVDKSRPAGMAIYLDSVFPPRFEFVAFAPLSDIDMFMSTLEKGPVVASPVPGENGRFELLGATNTSQVRVENGYAFIQLPIMDPDEEFDRDLLDPLTHFSRITRQYDISITLDVESIPKATRRLLTSFVTSTMSTQMQQRDEEADGLYEMRRAWMQGDIDSIKLLLDECRRLSLGISVEPETRLAHLDFLIDVQEGSDLLQEMLSSVTRQSYFAPILNDSSAVSLSMSQMLPDRDRQRYSGILEGLKLELSRQIEVQNLGPELDQTSPVLAGITALQDTINEGHLDIFGQCYADPDDNLVVVAAVRVEDGETIAAGLADMLNRLQGQPGLKGLQIGFEEHSGIEFHRIVFDTPEPARDAILGPESGVVFGCGPRSLWLGLGGEHTMETIGSVMTELVAAYEQPTQQVRSSNLRLVVNVDQLIQLGDAASSATSAAASEKDEGAPETTELPKGKPKDNRRTSFSRRRRRDAKTQAAREASWRDTFAEGGDRIRVDYQPSDTGGRVRVELGEAFLKGIGRAIAIRLQGNSDSEH